MNFTSRLRNLFGLETKAITVVSPDDWADVFGATPTASNIFVTPKIAMTCSPWHAAVQAVAEAIGGLPVHVYRRTADAGKDIANDHPVAKLFRDKVNDWTSASSFREQLTRDAMLFPGGGFARIVRVNGNEPFELHRIDQEKTPVTVEANDFGEPVYKLAANGRTETIAFQDMFHLPSPSLNERGLVHEAREAIGLALIMERHAARLFGNGARPSGLISLKNVTTPDALMKAKAAWQASNAGANSGGTAVLPADAEWQALTLTSVDAQFLELRSFAINEISRFTRVPPHMLGQLERAIQSNIEQQAQDFLSNCLMPWVSRWESEIRLKLLSTPDESGAVLAEFLLDNYARADLAARMEAYGKAITNRILNPNEVRALENRPPYEGGDTFENPNTSRGAAQ